MYSVGSSMYLQLKNMEMGKDTIIDPEKYMDDPTEYMMKKNIYK